MKSKSEQQPGMASVDGIDRSSTPCTLVADLVKSSLHHLASLHQPSHTVHGGSMPQQSSVQLALPFNASSLTIDQHRDLSNRELYPVIIGLALAVLLAALDQTIVATALPQIARDFSAFNQVSWVGTAYLLTSTACQPLYGRFSDIFGRRAVILFAILLFLLGSLGCGLAWSMLSLIMFRALAGIGGAGLSSLVMVILTDITTPQRCGQFQGAIGAIYACSSVIGPLIGGVFTDQITWRWAFYVNIPIGAITVGTILWALRLPPVIGSMRSKLRRIDWLGSILIIAANVLLLLPTAWGGHAYPWNSPVIIALYCVGGVVLLTAIVWEGWGCSSFADRKPLIPPHLFRQPSIVALFVSVFGLGWCFFGQVYYYPTYYQLVHGYSATQSGLAMIPLIITVSVFAYTSGWLVGRIARRWIYRAMMLVGLALLLVSNALMQLLGRIDPAYTLPFEITMMVFTGTGIGLHIQTSLMAAQRIASRKDMAVVTTMITFFRVVGGVFGIAVLGAVLSNAMDLTVLETGQLAEDLTPERQAELATAFRHTYTLLIPASAVSFAAVLFVRLPSPSAVEGGNDLPHSSLAVADSALPSPELPSPSMVLASAAIPPDDTLTAAMIANGHRHSIRPITV